MGLLGDGLQHYISCNYLIYLLQDSLHLQPPKSDHKENATVTCVNKKHSTAPVIVTTDESKSQSSPTHQPHPIKQSESLSATPQGKVS